MITLQRKSVVTRKAHHCWGCWTEYPAGTRMEYSVQKDDAYLSATYWCAVCIAFIQTLHYWDTEDGWVEGGLKDYDDYEAFRAAFQPTETTVRQAGRDRWNR